ncbi:Splicing factor [Coemansia sp. RSA 2399]|nr:Splicing factor [Coemansia sp. RSA 2399]
MSAELEALNNLEEFMGGLPEKLDKTPYDYSTYIRWLELLREVGDIESMRLARMTMSSRLAVPEDVWMEWVEDERIQQPDGFGDAAKIRQLKDLFDTAVQEYMSPSMWQKYIDFVKELDDSEHDNVRAAAGEVFGHSDFALDTLEQAVAATNAYYNESQAIWLQYKSHLEHYITNTADIEDDRNMFVGKLQATFLKRLGQPHAEIEDTFNMYSGFVTNNLAASEYESQMVYATGIVGDTRIKCAKRESLEGNIEASGGSWYSFSLYIGKLSGEKQADMQEISCLFERALIHNYCYPEVWDEYITTVACSSDAVGDALRVAGRAIRNCPWSGKLWAQLLSLTYACHGYQHAADIYDIAVATHALEHSMFEFSNLALSMVNAGRQEYQASESESADAERLLGVCSGCIEAAYGLDISTADPMLRLERCCTFITTTLLCNEAETRKLWTRICKARRNCTEAWILSAEFEQMHGSISNARGVYHHAAQRKLDNPERLFDAWLTFEHIFGEQTAVSKAEHFINTQRHLIRKRAERSTANGATDHYAVPQTGDIEIVAAGASLKRTHSAASQDSTQQPETLQDAVDTTCSRNNTEAAPTSVAAISTAACTTVFVSNLPVSCKETQLVELLGGTGCVENVELSKNKDGSFRGQARADLRSTDALVSALDKNGFRLDNQRISIHIFKQHYQGAHQVSVTVKGFSPETGNKKIEIIAKEAGGFVRIRRNQQGDVAHVFMKSMDDAIRAVSELNGRVVDGSTLEAHVSDMPEANVVPTRRPTNIHATTHEQHGAAQNMASTSLVPRKTAVPSRRPAKRVKIAKPSADDVPKKPDEGLNTGVQSSMHNKKSNDEFRQMFLSGGDQV